MSRKARNVAQAQSSGGYATAGCLAANLGYRTVKPSKMPDHIAVVLYASDEAAPQPGATTLASRMGPILPALQKVLMATTKRNDSPAAAIFVLDCTPLVPAGSKAQWMIEKEAKAGPQPGKQLGKPVGRLLQKLLVGHKGSVSLVGVDGGASLALLLLQALPAEHGLTEGSIDRVVLLRPFLSAAVVNAYLTQASQAKPPIVDVIYSSRSLLEKRDVAVRHAYPKGTSRVLDAIGATGPGAGGLAAVGGALYASLLTDGSALDSDTLEAEAEAERMHGGFSQLDPDASDAVGQSVFWSEVSFEMSRDTKQQQAIVREIDAHQLAEEIATVAAGEASSGSDAESAEEEASADPDGGKVSPQQHKKPQSTSSTPLPQQSQCIGALILRGNRCVLARSLSSPPAWKGMCIPTTPLQPGESEIEGAMRAAAEFCDIDDAHLEFKRVPSVPPVSLFVRLGEGLAHATVYPLYATRPPPGALEEADVTDDEDSYDWYTWPRATHALKHDARSLMCLRTMACGIATAVNAGRLPSKWGGHFGQEWLGAPTSAGEPEAPPLPETTVEVRQEPKDKSPDSVSARLASLEAKMDLLLSAVSGGILYNGGRDVCSG